MPALTEVYRYVYKVRRKLWALRSTKGSQGVAAEREEGATRAHDKDKEEADREERAERQEDEDERHREEEGGLPHEQFRQKTNHLQCLSC